MNPLHVRLGLRELQQKEVVASHPPLVERKRGIVSQAEYSFLIADKVVRLTESSE